MSKYKNCNIKHGHYKGHCWIDDWDSSYSEICGGFVCRDCGIKSNWFPSWGMGECPGKRVGNV